MIARPPRASSSVVLVRPDPDRDGGWQTYLVQQSTNSPLLADYWVFPGGTLRPDDFSPASQGLSRTFPSAAAHDALSRPPGGPAASPPESLAYFVAAARELFEEAGILLGRMGLPGATVEEATTPETVSSLRLALEAGRPFGEIAAQLGIELDLGRLLYYAHWTTPEAVPQRFDTRFFIAVLPEGQSAVPSPHEVAQGQWINVGAALENSRSRTMQLHFATLNHLERLRPFERLDELVHFASTKPVHPVLPPTRERGDRIIPYLPPEIDGIW